MIPKKDKPLKKLETHNITKLKNKIASKVIATGLKAGLEILVDNEQSAFLKGCSIAENIWLINTVISNTESKNIPGLRLFLDFEKVFDTVESAFIEKTFCHLVPALLLWSWESCFIMIFKAVL